MLEELQKEEDPSKEDKKKIKELEDFVNVYKASKGFRMLGKLYGLNQGLPNDANAMFQYKSSIEGFMEKEYEIPFDFIRFIKDDDYKKLKINEFDKKRVGFNILWALDNSPHFMSYAKIFTVADATLGAVSNKHALRDELLTELITSNYFTKSSSVKMKDRMFNGASNYLDLLYTQLYLTNKKRKVTVNRQVLLLPVRSHTSTAILPTLRTKRLSRLISTYHRQSIKQPTDGTQIHQWHKVLCWKKVLQNTMFPFRILYRLLNILGQKSVNQIIVFF